VLKAKQKVIEPKSQKGGFVSESNIYDTLDNGRGGGLEEDRERCAALLGGVLLQTKRVHGAMTAEDRGGGRGEKTNGGKTKLLYLPSEVILKVSGGGEFGVLQNDPE